MAITVQAFLAMLVERGMSLTLDRKWSLHLLPKGSHSKLSPEERAFLAKHNAELKTLVQVMPDKRIGPLQPRTQPQLQSQPSRVPAQPEPVPEVYVRGLRITEAHVREAMEAAGDLHDYEAGRISKVEAYDRARVRLRQLQDLYGVR